MRKFFIALLLIPALCFQANTSAAQNRRLENKDSVTIVNARWNTVKVAKGVTFKQALFPGTLFGSNQVISILEIKPGKAGQKNKPVFAFTANEPLTRTSELAQELNAIAAVNGTFFSFQKPHNAVDYLKIDNTEICGNDYGKKNTRLFNQLGALAIDENGALSILKADTADLNWEKSIQANSIMTSGPILIVNKSPETLKTDSFYTTRHPRTAVAATDNGKIWLITVDGRAAQAQGMSLSELQSLFKWLGVTDLLNLDGGGSTTMYVNSQGVVNYPTDNKTFDHKGERKVANAVVVMLSK